MKERVSYCALAVLPGVLLVLTSLWLSAVTRVRANPGARYVDATGSDAGGNVCIYENNPCKTIQHAIDVSDPGDEIRVAGGTYSRAGTVAAITKEVAIIGAYDPGFSGVDPDMYQTVLDAQWGGSVISITNGGDVSLLHLTLSHGDGEGNCNGTGCGGGIYAIDTTVHVGHCVISNNVGSTVGPGTGGGIYIDNHNSSAPAHIWESRIVSNTASTADTGWGGGVWLMAGRPIAPATLISTTIEDNTGSTAGWGQGGGMFLFQYATLTNNLFWHNFASTATSELGQGGGLYLWEAWDVALHANEFVSNTASALGKGEGGAIYGSARVVMEMANNVLAGNHASSAGGGLALFTWDPSYLIQGTLVHNTIADNDAGAAGEGIWMGTYVSLTLTNNIIAGHTVGISNTVPESSTVIANYTLFDDNVKDYGNGVSSSNEVSGDPDFVAPETGDYHIGINSAAIDAGVDAGVEEDIDGDSRPVGPAPDIGADELYLRRVYMPLVLKLY